MSGCRIPTTSISKVDEYIEHRSDLSLLAKNTCLAFPCDIAPWRGRRFSFAWIEKHKHPQAVLARLILERHFQYGSVVALHDSR